MQAIKSIYIWVVSALIIFLWLPILALVRITDRDPALYRTGRTFRILGKTLTKVNPNWNVTVSGHHISNPRNPYIVVANHQSLGDIPVISNLPWEMKWVAKQELFEIPVLGWLMKLAGDIPVNRKGVRRWEQVSNKAGFYLNNRCSVMIFPEGTRSEDGELQRFTDGAFALAIKHQVPVLPIVVDGTANCLPKNSWKFNSARNIRVHVLPPLSTENFTSEQSGELREQVHHLIREKLAEMRRN